MPSSERDSFVYFDKGFCLNIKSNQKNYILLGDSHAAHLWRALDKAFPEVNVMQATALGCRPLVSFLGKARCTDLIKFIINEFIIENKIDGVILSARWNEHELGLISPTVNYLLKHVNHVVVLGPTIEYSESLPEILAGKASFIMSSNEIVGKRYVLPSKIALSKQIGQALENSGAIYVPIIPTLCPNNTCKVVSESGEPMSFDYGHFTLSGANTLVEMLKTSGELSLP